MTYYKDKLFPLGDYHPANKVPLLPSLGVVNWPPKGIQADGQEKEYIVARGTGEYRPPKAGEWYLSGSIVTAYHIKHDLNDPYHIAEIVWVKIRPEIKILNIETLDKTKKV